MPQLSADVDIGHGYDDQGKYKYQQEHSHFVRDGVAFMRPLCDAPVSNVYSPHFLVDLLKRGINQSILIRSNCRLYSRYHFMKI